MHQAVFQVDRTMPSARSSIVALQRPAILAAAAVVARVFERDPMFTHIFPNQRSRLRALRSFFQSGLQYGTRYGVVHTTPDLAGCALWLTPEHPAITVVGMARSGMLLLPLRLGVAAFRRFVAVVSYTEACHQQAISEPHWYLLNLGVDPVRQGRGVGSALLGPVLAHADALGQACYLETNTQRNVRFYERHGFGVAQHGRVLGDGPQFWAMIRPAQRS